MLDLSGLTFIDCSNIGLIHRAGTAAARRGARLEVRGASPHLRRVFDLAGFVSSNGSGLVPAS
ncbi:MAG TPA: STAS domain-containing protein [Actinomycetota bacterium]|nr:STAS domain-containing protein [Actinomycetota bacterium]